MELSSYSNSDSVDQDDGGLSVSESEDEDEESAEQPMFARSKQIEDREKKVDVGRPSSH